MAINYTSLAATALRLLSDNGMEVEILRSDGGTLDPVTSTVTGAADTTSPITIVELPYKQGQSDFDEKYREDLVRGNLTRAITATDATFVPRIGDRLKWDNVEKEIIEMKTVSPAGTPVIYHMGLLRK